MVLHKRGELVVIELRLCQPGTLLQHYDRVSRRGEFLRDDAAGRSRSYDREINRIAREKLRTLL